MWGNWVKRTLRSENYVDTLQCMSSPTRKLTITTRCEVVGQLFNNSISRALLLIKEYADAFITYVKQFLIDESTIFIEDTSTIDTNTIK